MGQLLLQTPWFATLVTPVAAPPARPTGKIYLGPMVTCLVFIMILISNTVIYLPL